MKKTPFILVGCVFIALAFECGFLLGHLSKPPACYVSEDTFLDSLTEDSVHPDLTWAYKAHGQLVIGYTPIKK